MLNPEARPRSRVAGPWLSPAVEAEGAVEGHIKTQNTQIFRAFSADSDSIASAVKKYGVRSNTFWFMLRMAISRPNFSSMQEDQANPLAWGIQ